MEKKFISMILAAVLVAGTFFGSNAVVIAAGNDITVTINGEKVSFPDPCVMEDGDLLAPYEEVFEALEVYDTLWLEEDQAVAAQKGNTLLVMLVGIESYIKEENGDGGVIYSMESAPLISDGSVLVPVRAAAEAFGYQTDWDEAARTLSISSERWVDGQNSATNGCLYNGVLYYSFIYQPYIYAYDGNTTTTYAAGGAPLGIVVSRNKIYYINKSNQSIYAISLSSGEREVVFSELSQISDFCIRGGKMVIIGLDDEDNQTVYSLDLEEGALELLYTRPDPSGLVREKESKFALWREYLFVVEPITPLFADKESSCKIIVIDTDTAQSFVAADIRGTVRKTNFRSSDIYTSCYSKVEARFDQENAYFNLTFLRNDNAAKKNESFCESFRIGLDSQISERMTEEEFDSVTDLAFQQAGNWVYGSDDSEVYRINTESGITETLIDGEDYYYITNDDQWVVVLRAESQRGTPTATKHYKYAEIYVMDTDGNHLQLINSYNPSSDSNSSLGGGSSAQPAAEPCAVCGGDGMVTCSYCRGSGQGQPIYVMGMLTQQGCTYCGGTGERLCSGCGGSGQK